MGGQKWFVKTVASTEKKASERTFLYATSFEIPQTHALDAEPCAWNLRDITSSCFNKMIADNGSARGFLTGEWKLWMRTRKHGDLRRTKGLVARSRDCDFAQRESESRGDSST